MKFLTLVLVLCCCLATCFPARHVAQHASEEEDGRQLSLLSLLKQGLGQFILDCLINIKTALSGCQNWHDLLIINDPKLFPKEDEEKNHLIGILNILVGQMDMLLDATFGSVGGLKDYYDKDDYTEDDFYYESDEDEDEDDGEDEKDEASSGDDDDGSYYYLSTLFGNSDENEDEDGDYSGYDWYNLIGGGEDNDSYYESEYDEKDDELETEGDDNGYDWLNVFSSGDDYSESTYDEDAEPHEGSANSPIIVEDNIAAGEVREPLKELGADISQKEQVAIDQVVDQLVKETNAQPDVQKVDEAAL